MYACAPDGLSACCNVRVDVVGAWPEVLNSSFLGVKLRYFQMIMTCTDLWVSTGAVIPRYVCMCCCDGSTVQLFRLSMFLPATGEAGSSCAVSLKYFCDGLPSCQARRFTLVDELVAQSNFATCSTRTFFTT